ncbi:hypothetical protein ACHAWU_009013 [Discostella pseudostelligera]|uniref:NAD(P)-binding domain-containing protein n=1 Tax=Discostella pseudostelligera TaxID=259834 RepID=A0ABD3MDH5_9STRA
MLESALVLAPRNRWANSTPISTHIHRCNLSFISSSMIDMLSLASLCLWLTWTSLLFIPADALSASSFVGCRNGGWGKKCRSSTRPACQLRMNLLPGQVSQKVIVTGAAGRTGSLVFSLLDADPRFDVVGLVRSESSAKKLIAKTNCALEEIVICDVTQMSFEHNTPTTTMSGSSSGNTWPTALENAEAMVICTSAVPQISKLSLFKAILKIPLNILNPEKKKAINFRDLQFKYKENQYPEVVDYVGQKKQIDFAKKLGVKHVVLVSSMGVLDPNNFLNQIGKDKYGNGHGDILLWKRKAEKYLCLSGLQYTIIHPGGLVDMEPNTMELVLDVDDVLMKCEKKSIARSDVANLCIAALTESGGRSVSFDCIGRQVEGTTTAVDTGAGSAVDAFRSFLATGRTADYTLGPRGM